MSDHWQARAACARQALDFAQIANGYLDHQCRIPNPDVVRARQICDSCPVFRQCKAEARDLDIAGFVAGMTEHERKVWRDRNAQRTMVPA